MSECAYVFPVDVAYFKEQNKTEWKTYYHQIKSIIAFLNVIRN